MRQEGESYGYPSKLVTTQDFVFPIVPTSIAGL